MEFYDDNDDILNSSLYSSEDTENEYFKNIFGNTNLKNGIVIKIYEIDDENNLNKKFPEYDVLVVEQKNTSTVEPVVYKNCIAIDSFGGVADFFEFKLRSVDKKRGEKTPVDTNFKEQFGSMVLLLCLDGSTDKGIIVNSVPHPGRKTTLTKEADVHLEGEYNGLNWQINKDGELTVTFKSKTDNEGNPQDETSGGTFAKIDKEGSVEIDTALEGDEATSLKLDKPGKNINAVAGANISAKAKANVDIEAGASVNAKADANIMFEAQGTAKYSSQSQFDIESGAILNVKAQSIQIQSSNLFQIQSNFAQLNSPVITLGAAGTPAVILTTKYLGTGNLGAPVVSDAIGPFSATVLVSP